MTKIVPEGFGKREPNPTKVPTRRLGWRKYPVYPSSPQQGLSEEDYRRFVERLNNGGKPPKEE